MNWSKIFCVRHSSFYLLLCNFFDVRDFSFSSIGIPIIKKHSNICVLTLTNIFKRSLVCFHYFVLITKSTFIYWRCHSCSKWAPCRTGFCSVLWFWKQQCLWVHKLSRRWFWLDKKYWIHKFCWHWTICRSYIGYQSR